MNSLVFVEMRIWGGKLVEWSRFKMNEHQMNITITMFLALIWNDFEPSLHGKWGRLRPVELLSLLCRQGQPRGSACYFGTFWNDKRCEESRSSGKPFGDMKRNV